MTALTLLALIVSLPMIISTDGRATRQEEPDPSDVYTAFDGSTSTRELPSQVDVSVCIVEIGQTVGARVMLEGEAWPTDDCSVTYPLATVWDSAVRGVVPVYRHVRDDAPASHRLSLDSVHLPGESEGELLFYAYPVGSGHGTIFSGLSWVDGGWSYQPALSDLMLEYYTLFGVTGQTLLFEASPL